MYGGCASITGSLLTTREACVRLCKRAEKCWEAGQIATAVD